MSNRSMKIILLKFWVMIQVFDDDKGPCTDWSWAAIKPVPGKGAGYTVDALYYGNIARSFNHRCYGESLEAVKVYFVHQNGLPVICFFSRKDIGRGEELTFRYDRGKKPWKEGECKCQHCVDEKETLIVTGKRSRVPSGKIWTR